MTTAYTTTTPLSNTTTQKGNYQVKTLEPLLGEVKNPNSSSSPTISGLALCTITCRALKGEKNLLSVTRLGWQ